MKKTKILSLLTMVTLLSAASCKSNDSSTSSSLTPSSSIPSSTQPSTSSEEKKSDDVAILYTNDVHCNIVSSGDSNVGYAQVAGKKKELLQKYNNVALVDAGDHLQGGTYGSITRGQAIVEIMNTAGYDVATIGNHEFDYGMDMFFQNAANAEYQYVSSNFMKGDENYFKPYYIKKFGEKKVAFVGVTTPDTYTSSTPAYFKKDGYSGYYYNFSEGVDREHPEPFYAAVQDGIDLAKSQGKADYVILLAHLGTDNVNSPYQSKDLIANVSGVSAVLDGHSHTMIEKQIVKDKDQKDVVLSSTKTALNYVGFLTIDGKGNIDTKLLAPEDLTATDPETKDLIDTIKAQSDEYLSTVIGNTNKPLTINHYDGDTNTGVRRVRKGETNLGNLIADSYEDIIKTYAEDHPGSGFDKFFGVVNGGSVRKNVSGQITIEDIINVSPFANKLCIYKTKGSVIKTMLEYSASKFTTGQAVDFSNKNDEFGGFLQPSSNLHFKINLNNDPALTKDEQGNYTGYDNSRSPRVQEIKINGSAIEDNVDYYFASSNYTIDSGGDGYFMFKMKGKVPAGEENIEDVTPSELTNTIDNQVSIDFISKLCATPQGISTLPSRYDNYAGEGRITFINPSQGN